MTTPGKTISVEDVISETIEDPASYYHGQAIRLLLTLKQEGGTANIQKAIFCLERLIEIQVQNTHSQNATRG